MGKDLETKLGFNTIVDVENMPSNIDTGMFLDKSFSKKTFPTLVSSLNYIEKINPYAGYNLGILQLEDSLRDEKVRNLIFKLAKAVDANSAMEIKRLKAQYGNTKEFAQAKRFLDRKCKEIWNVFDNKNSALEIPKAAMKTLGISNQPSLDFLFEDCLKYFEKENSKTTVDVIKSVLNNVNIDYTFEDILKYLKTMREKRVFDYNIHTAKFLAQHLMFKKHRLNDIGISKEQVNTIFKSLSVSEKLICVLNYYLNFAQNG